MSPTTADPRLIVPLDVPDRAAAEALVERLGPGVSFYKIGLELLAGDGMALARALKASGRQVFLDWKLHDIGETVRRAAAAIAEAGAGDLLTVHAEPQVLAAAVEACEGGGLAVLGVTVLTSLGPAELEAIGYAPSVEALVERRIRQALEAGAGGVVASPHEAALARRLALEAGRPDFLVVTPGVRPAWAARNDQVRAATPASALRAGATHLVCGRPITAAADPAEAAARVVAEMAEQPRG